MAKLTKVQCENLIYVYLLHEGWLPPGTTKRNWRSVEIGNLGIDDPPLPSDPHLQKKRAALDIQKFFEVLGSKLTSILPELKKKTNTLLMLAHRCYEKQV